MVAGTKSSKGRPGAAGGEAMEVSPGPSPAGLHLGSQGPPGNAHSTGRLGCLQGQKAQGTFGEGAFARGRLGAELPTTQTWGMPWAPSGGSSGPGSVATAVAGVSGQDPSSRLPLPRLQQSLGTPASAPTGPPPPRVARAFTAGVAVETPLTAGPTCPGNAPPKSGRSPAVSGS